MKKTSKSPENVEVTPNKKKLKQARLPFMLLSDVSPKAETPPSRKRKLSVPDAVPATKVGKISKENSLSEELVVISDEESRGLPNPKTQEKLPNPYVKLVDAARKKKLQKTKGQKKPKGKSTKKSSQASETQAQNDTSDNKDYEDVEMMEVEALVHKNDDEDAEKNKNSVSNGDMQGLKNDKELKTTETNNNTKNKKESPQKVSQESEEKSEESSKEGSSKGKQIEINTKNVKESIAGTVGETICIDDSNNSSDVKIPKNTERDQQQITNDEKNVKKQTQSPANIKKRTSKQKSQDTTPKRSSRSKTKNEKSEVQKKVEAVKSEVDPKESVEYQKQDEDNQKRSSASEKEDNTELPQEENDSDIEMIEPLNEQEGSKEKSEESSSEKEDSKSKSEGLVTPKRSNKNKETESNLDVSVCSTLDESMTSNPSTPKQADKSLNESLKNLTPKQMAKRLEAAKKREEREKEKQEREKKRQQEKEERAKQRQEKEDQKKREREEKEEAKRKEREEKEEQKKKEREEKEKLKEQEKKIREEKEEAKRKEKEEKEEQKKKEKEAREEERRKKQEALELEKQEQEMKLKKTKEAFVSFFVPKQKVEKESTPSERAPVSKSSMLSSFTIKVDMRLAPTCRVELDVERKEALVKSIQEQNDSENYLTHLKQGKTKPGSCGKTWPLDEKDDDVMIVEDELPPIDGAGEVIPCESAPRERLRPKLFSFHENRRPPYWGTWRKKSQLVKPRRPFGQEKQVDYEVDSDEEWEDEADGESLDGSAGGSDDDAGNDDYEVDHELFVPHGYLSDEEATMDEEEGDGDMLSLSPETQKVRLKHLEDEFESELKKPTEKLKPRLYGLLWETSEGKKPEKCVDALWNYFEKFAMIMDDVTPLLQPAPEPEKEAEKKKIKKKKAVEGEGNEQSPKSKKKKEPKAENKEAKKPKPEAKKSLPNQPGINTFLKKVNTT